LINKAFWSALSACFCILSGPSAGRIPFIHGARGSGKTLFLRVLSSFLCQKRFDARYTVVYASIPENPVSACAIFEMLFFATVLAIPLAKGSSTVPSSLHDFECWLQYLSKILSSSSKTLVILVDGYNHPNDVVFRTLVMSICSISKSVRLVLTSTDYFGKAPFPISDLSVERIHLTSFFSRRSLPLIQSLFRHISDLKSDVPNYVFKELYFWTSGSLHLFQEYMKFYRADAPFDSLDASRRYIASSFFIRLGSLMSNDVKTLELMASLLCRVILQLPLSLATDCYSSLEVAHLSRSCLPHAFLDIFHPSAILRHYHPRDSYACYVGVPSFKSNTSSFIGTSYCTKWSQILCCDIGLEVQKLLVSFLSLKSICNETRRKLTRNYMRFLLANAELLCFSLNVRSELKEVEYAFKGTEETLFFSGLLPSRELLLYAMSRSSTDIILIPGRPDYCFFDFFVINKSIRKFFAFSSIPGSHLWSSSTVSSLSLRYPVDTNSLGPHDLIEMWMRLFREVGHGKMHATILFYSSSTFPK
jgi:hypothetical protein